MSLQRLILTFTAEGIEVRTLYRRQDGPNPGTKARTREVAEIARTGLEQALEALDGEDAMTIGTSGFTTREDTLSLSVFSSNAPTLVKYERKETR